MQRNLGPRLPQNKIEAKRGRLINGAARPGSHFSSLPRGYLVHSSVKNTVFSFTQTEHCRYISSENVIYFGTMYYNKLGLRSYICNF